MEVREGLQGSDILGETLKMTRSWSEAVGGVGWSGPGRGDQMSGGRGENLVGSV